MDHSAESISELCSEGVARIERDGTLVALNPAMRRLIGESATIGDLGVDQSRLAAHLSSDGVREPFVECVELPSTSGPRALELRAGVDGDGRWVLVAEDRTEQLLLRAELRRLIRLRQVGQMSAGLIHELNNAFGAVEGFAAHLGRTIEASESRAFLEHLRRSAHKAAVIARSLTEYLAQGRPSITPIAFAAVIDDAISLVQKQAALGEIEVTTAVEPDLPAVRIRKADAVGVLTHVLLHAHATVGQRRQIHVTANTDASGPRRFGVALVEVDGDTSNDEYLLALSGPDQPLQPPTGLVGRRADLLESLLCLTLAGGRFTVGADRETRRFQLSYPSVSG